MIGQSALLRVATAAATIATAAATALSATSPAQATTPAPPPAPATSVPSGSVVVVLKDQLDATPADRGHGAQRTSLARQRQQSVLDRLPGGQPAKLRQFSVGDAFAATVTPTQADALAADPSVAAVVPDVSIPLTPHTTNAQASPGRTPACPTDPAHPLVDPEGLSLTHAASIDGTPSAADLADGSGVTVGVLADGVDTNVPDFVRPDGSNIVTSNVDFTGVPGQGGEETTGDISTIGAQGVVHDLHDNTPSIPAGCTVRIEGVAPGANIVAMNGIGTFTPVSDLLQGIDYATNVAHVDVLNESWGLNTITDPGVRNAFTLFNDEAVAAGVTVVAASGDAGVTSTMGVPATDPHLISVGATTAFRTLAQLGFTGTNGKWDNNNIAEFSSSGFTSTGSTVDLVAPGYEGWVARADQPAGITTFGGTSEAAPFAAGTAALVIQAYRRSHHGASPSPALVKTLITSTADDLGASPQDQGAGLLDARAAVEAALTYPGATGPTPASVASHVVVSDAQVNLQGAPGSNQKISETVTNVGTRPVTVAPSLHRFAPVATHSQSLTLAGGTPTTIPLPVADCDLLRVRIYNGTIDHGFGHAELLDPSGTLVNLSAPQGASAYAMLTGRPCTTGTWSLVLPAELTGPTSVELDTYRKVAFGRSDTDGFTLAPGASRRVTTSVTVPADGGDTAYEMAFATPGGHVSVVPVTVRTVLSLGSANSTFTGTFTGGNGRNGILGNEQRFVYAVDVPEHAPALHVAFNLQLPAGVNPDAIQGDLVSPDGEIANQTIAGSLLGIVLPGAAAVTSFDLTTLAPAKGRWLVVLSDIGGSQNIGQNFTATLSNTSPATVTSGLPTTAKQVISAGSSLTVPVTVTNHGTNPLTIQADPRTTTNQTYPLVLTLLGLVPTDGPQAMPSSLLDFGVPLGTTSFTATSSSTVPNLVSLVGPGATIIATGDLKRAQAGGTVSTATVAEPGGTIAAGVWGVDAAQIGPFTETAPFEYATITGSVVTAGFDRTMTVAADDTSKIGPDPYLPEIDPTLSGGLPAQAVVPPGGSLTFRMTITPTAKPGTVVHGVLNIVTDSATAAIAAVPYSYTVGAAGK